MPEPPRRARGLGAAGLLAAWLLAGCGARDNVEPPAPLPDYDAELKVRDRWVRDVGGGSGKKYLGLSPYLENARLFTADYHGGVYALDSEHGDKIWYRDTGLSITSGIGGGDGLLFVGSEEGKVLALRQEDGGTVWQADVTSEVLSPPVLAGGVVLVRTLDGRLFGFSALDGTRVWVITRSVPALSLRGTSRPTVVQGVVFSGFDNGKLSALSITGGRTLWEVPVSVPQGRSELERMVDVDARPVFQDGLLYSAAFQGRLVAIQPERGQLLWSKELSTYRDFVVDGDQILVTDETGFVWALDRRTGVSLWRQEKLRARNLTAPVLQGDYVVVGDLKGYVHWLSRSDGRYLARRRAGEYPIVTAPLVEDDRVYVLDTYGDLHAFRVRPIERR